MITLQKLLIIFTIGLISVEMFAYDGMPTPPLHIEGRWLKDPTGKNIMLHGWMQPNDSYFNGRLFNNPTTFTPEDCASALNMFNKMAEFLTDTSSLFGYDHGWKSSFVRIGAPGDGWDDYGLVDTALFKRAWDNLYIPYIDYCRSRGLYVVLIGSVPSPEFMGAQYKANLIAYWKWIASYPGLKNVDNVMFEICNEPVDIESELGNDDWGSWKDEHDKAISVYMQDIVDTIRATGAENIIWVPGLVWQAKLKSFAKYPITGTNIGYAGHRYPVGANDAEEITNSFNNDWKLCSDKYPVIVTEGSWHTMGIDQGLRTGTTEVFGSTIKKLYDEAGNISWMAGMIGEVIGGVDEGLSPDQWTYSNVNCGRAAFHWWSEYSWCAPDDGTPKFESALVTEDNPKQIKVLFNRSIIDSGNFDGFAVKVDNQAVTIDSVVLGDTNQLVIHLSKSILKDNEVTLSYGNGNVVSVYEKNLVEISNELVDNLLKGASPRMVELKTNEDGDTLMVKFNKKMLLPSDFSSLTLNAEYNGNIDITILQSSYFDNDSTLLLFSLDDQVYGDYSLSLSYSGNKISSSDSGLLKTFSGFPVTNCSQSLPVTINTGKIESDGKTGIFEFSKPLSMVTEHSTFTLKVNDKNVSFLDFYSFHNTIRFTLPDNLHFGDNATLSYTPGNVTAADLGLLEGFSDFPVTNLVGEPEWIQVSGRVEAENYSVQSGIQTENTSDDGGGLNVGWIDNGDWMEYGIENNSSATYFEISFRIAAPSSDGKFDYYLDNKRIGQVDVPSSGGWQNWQSVVKNMTISPGKHYLKLVATSAGFNINYIDIHALITGVETMYDNGINIYPNPVSDRMIICSEDFQYNNVEIFDIMGNTVLSKSAAYEPELYLPVSLPNGMYIVKISNGSQFRYKRIVIKND